MLGQSAAAIALACSTWAVAAQASMLGRSADGGATDLSSFAATLAIALAVVPRALACCAGRSWGREGLLTAAPAAAIAAWFAGNDGALLIGSAVLVMLIVDAIRYRR
jgi:hypothetical protein